MSVLKGQSRVYDLPFTSSVLSVRDTRHHPLPLDMQMQVV